MFDLTIETIVIAVIIIIFVLGFFFNLLIWGSAIIVVILILNLVYKYFTKPESQNLFNILSKDGVFKIRKNTKSEIIMKKNDIDHILMFSDRPYKLIKDITVAELMNKMTNLKKNPLNATLIIKNEIYTVQLKKMIVRDTKIIFNVVPTDSLDIETLNGSIKIFIDSNK
jgi:hypothetical protein